MELIFQEGGFLIKTLNTPEEMEAALRLRHQVFCDELKWVPPSEDLMERDGYDGFSQCIGVFDGKDQLAGHARLICSPNPFMIEKEFACLLPEGTRMLKPHDMAEVTRLCLGKQSRQSYINVSQILYKGIYQWSLLYNVRYLAMVVEKKYYRLLRLNGFPVENMGHFLEMGDGVMAAVITLDWRKFEREAGEKKPEQLEWISKLPAFGPGRLQRHGLY